MEKNFERKLAFCIERNVHNNLLENEHCAAGFFQGTGGSWDLFSRCKPSFFYLLCRKYCKLRPPADLFKNGPSQRRFQQNVKVVFHYLIQRCLDIGNFRPVYHEYDLWDQLYSCCPYRKSDINYAYLYFAEFIDWNLFCFKESPEIYTCSYRLLGRVQHSL